MTTTPHLPGKFVWFEHVSDDIPKARAFYDALFGWRSDAVPVGAQQYHMIQNRDAGIGGFRSATNGMPNHWISYLSVPDVDASTQAAVAAGAALLMPPTDFDPIGRGSAITDPTGAALCIWKTATGDQPDTESIAPGDWYWNECWTPDNKKALAFYTKVFGYGHESMDMGPQGTYYMLTSGGVPRGGLMRVDQPGSKPGWLSYVSVTDCDAAIGKAEKLGGKVLLPPTEVPGVGRFAVFADPLGAVLGVIKGVRTG